MLVDAITKLNFKPESLHMVTYEGVVIDFNYSQAFLFGDGMSRFKRRSRLCECGCEEYTRSGNKYIFGHQRRGKIPHNKGKANKITILCAHCKKTKEISFWLKKKYNFCNSKCSSKWRSKNKTGENSPTYKGKITILCAWCKKTKEIFPSQNQEYNHNFCNRKCMGKWYSKNKTKENHPCWTEKTIIFCAQCDKSKKIIPSLKREYNFCNQNCHSKWMSKNRCGENSPTWKGGISAEPYCKEWNFDEFKELIRNRDNNECQNPFCKNNCNPNHKLCVHHIDNNKKNCELWNLISLCRGCNAKAEGNKKVPRIWWQKFYQNIMTEKYKYRY